MRGFVTTVLLVLTMDVTSGQIGIQPIPRYPVIGGSVTLSVNGITRKLTRFIWYKGPFRDDDYEILKYVNTLKRPLFLGPLYTDRIIAFDNGSLQINNLQVADGGNYIVKLRGVSLEEDTHVTLTVYEPVTKPKITASITQPKEFDTLKLTCDTSDAVIIAWTRNGASISSGAKLSGDNKILTFSSIKREDSGEYRCKSGNIVGTSTSDPYTVTVAYGPDTPYIEEFIDYRFILGLAMGLILGVLLIIFGSVCLYWKIIRKKRNEMSENRQDLIDVYYNVGETQPTSASVYMGLQCRTEDIYSELH